MTADKSPGQLAYEAAVEATIAKHSTSSVRVMMRDGATVPRPLPKFVPWDRLSQVTCDGWERRAAR